MQPFSTEGKHFRDLIRPASSVSLKAYNLSWCNRAWGSESDANLECLDELLDSSIQRSRIDSSLLGNETRSRISESEQEHYRQIEREREREDG